MGLLSIYLSRLSVTPVHCTMQEGLSMANRALTKPSRVKILNKCNGVVERQRTAELVKNGDHSRRMAAIRFYLLSRRQFSAHPKSSRARIDKRTVWAARNTHYRYSKNAPLDHKMADDCVSLAHTNTVSSTITKPVKTWKTSNESYSYNLLNHINKMYTHDLFYLQREWEAWLAPVYKQIQTT